MANFQKIPHKERMRHIKYRDEQWVRDEERHEREVIKRMIAEKEAVMRGESHPMDDKTRQVIEGMQRLNKLMEATDYQA